MKSSKYIQNNLDLKEMEAIFEDSSVPVPPLLGKDLEKSLDLLSSLEGESVKGGGKPLSDPQRKVRALRTWASVAAAAVLLLSVGLGYLFTPAEPEDTFSDPALAYAQVEEAMGKISRKMAQGVQAVRLPAQMIKEGLDNF